MQGTLLLSAIQALPGHAEAAEEGNQECPVVNKAHPGQSDSFRPGKRLSERDFGNGLVAYTVERVLQLLTRAAGNQPGRLLALACPVQSVLSPSQRFWTVPLGPNPLGLCAGGNKLSATLFSQSRLMSLVVAATLIRLRSGFGSHFGSARAVEETSLSSLTGLDCCHLVLSSGSARVMGLVLPIFQPPSPWRCLHLCRSTPQCYC